MGAKVRICSCLILAVNNLSCLLKVEEKWRMCRGRRPNRRKFTRRVDLVHRGRRCRGSEKNCRAERPGDCRTRRPRNWRRGAWAWKRLTDLRDRRRRRGRRSCCRLNRLGEKIMCFWSPSAVTGRALLTRNKVIILKGRSSLSGRLAGCR